MTEVKLRVQSKKASLVETITNTVVGLLIAQILNEILFRVYHVKATHAQTFYIVSWMTLASVLRGYLLRRLFNAEFWKRWTRKRVVIPDTKAQSVYRLGCELCALTEHEAKKLNTRLLSFVQNEIERVLQANQRKQ